MEDLAVRFQANLAMVQERISTAAISCGRKPEEVTLVVVTKTQSVEVIEAVARAGAKVLGENYPEETLSKIKALEGVDISWHMIGHLQSRKARIVASHFQMMHSLDRVELADKLNRILGETGRNLPVLLEVNVSGEESKFGLDARVEERWEGLLDLIGQFLTYPHLQVRGLMTMPPLFDTPEPARPYFARLRRLQDYLGKQFPNASWNELSMGTSADFEVAIQEGATLVRVGQAILGQRH